MKLEYGANEVDVLASRNLKQSALTFSTWAVSNTTTEASGEAFNNYAATTTDPGMEFFIIALVNLLFSIVVLYCLSWRWIAKRADESDDEKLTNKETAQNPIIIESKKMQARSPAESKQLSDELSVCNDNNHVSTPTEGGRFLRESRLLFGTVAKYDDETHKIIRLVIPLTFSAIATSSSGLFKVAIISHYVGTDALIAYAMVDGLLGISSSFNGGWVQAVNSVSSMACGAKNYQLSGKYVQIACIMYTLCEIPMGIVWIASMGRVVLFMEFDESVAVIAQRYVVVGILINIIGGSIDCFLGFLYSIEKEGFANTLYCTSSVIGVGMMFVAAKLDASLVTLGIAMLVNYCLLFFLIVVIPLKNGWFKEFENGLFGRLSLLEDSRAAKNLFQVAVPLAFGGILTNAQWEILTMLAVILGPAEAATWAIMGYIWNVFESTTEAVGNASETWVAFQLGEGRPDLAKLVSYKSMLIVSIMSIVMSTLLMSLTNVLPSLMTKDATIQDMLAELFPLVALGNVTMSMGMVCWAIVGAQGRYEISTMIATCCAFLVTIPIGMVSVVMRINLQGLTFAVVIGYTVTAMLLSAVIILSDWDILAKEIQEQVAAEEEYSDCFQGE
ncbi:hypothetical protein ACHAW5_007488 [Stephanodiscus triporus]|uniref:Uncharacterized protein n=1 Tax=Stephanodiscus triporus TaxID=2934178 RepID=A0ABD3NNW9_9STRA